MSMFPSSGYRNRATGTIVGPDFALSEAKNCTTVQFNKLYEEVGTPPNKAAVDKALAENDAKAKAKAAPKKAAATKPAATKATTPTPAPAKADIMLSQAEYDKKVAEAVANATKSLTEERDKLQKELDSFKKKLQETATSKTVVAKLATPVMIEGVQRYAVIKPDKLLDAYASGAKLVTVFKNLTTGESVVADNTSLFVKSDADAVGDTELL